VALPAFARCAPMLLSAGRAKIDRYFLPAAAMQTCSNGFAAVVHDGTDRRTGGQRTVT